MTIHEAVNKFIQSRNDSLVLIDRQDNGQWELVNKDSCPDWHHFNFIDSEVVFSVLTDIMDRDLLIQLVSNLSA